MGAPVELKDDQMETDKRSNTKETQELVDNNQLEAELKSLQGLAKQGKLQEAVDALLNIEKQQRLAEDIGGTKLACIAILEVMQVDCTCAVVQCVRKLWTWSSVLLFQTNERLSS